MSSKCYEVEIRFKVEDPAEAYALLPFLEEGLSEPVAWETQIIGREIYESGRLLRIGRVPLPTMTNYFLDYKGEDVGTFANIRAEWGEEISSGVTESAILPKLGLADSYASVDEIRSSLAEAGYTPFMDFSGKDRVGYYAPLQLHTKLMWCPKILGRDFLVELEVAANTLEEAFVAEATLKEIAERYGIIDRLIHDEPPTLLFQRSF